MESTTANADHLLYGKGVPRFPLGEAHLIALAKRGDLKRLLRALGGRPLKGAVLKAVAEELVEDFVRGRPGTAASLSPDERQVAALKVAEWIESELDPRAIRLTELRAIDAGEVLYQYEDPITVRWLNSLSYQWWQSGLPPTEAKLAVAEDPRITEVLEGSLADFAAEVLGTLLEKLGLTPSGARVWVKEGNHHLSGPGATEDGPLLCSQTKNGLSAASESDWVRGQRCRVCQEQSSVNGDFSPRLAKERLATSAASTIKKLLERVQANDLVGHDGGQLLLGEGRRIARAPAYSRLHGSELLPIDHHLIRRFDRALDRALAGSEQAVEEIREIIGAK